MMNCEEQQTPYQVFGATQVREDEITEAVSCLRSGWLGTGSRTARFERDFTKDKGVHSRQVAAVNSCTPALRASMILARDMKHAHRARTFALLENEQGCLASRR